MTWHTGSRDASGRKAGLLNESREARQSCAAFPRFGGIQHGFDAMNWRQQSPPRNAATPLDCRHARRKDSIRIRNSDKCMCTLLAQYCLDPLINNCVAFSGCRFVTANAMSAKRCRDHVRATVAIFRFKCSRNAGFRPSAECSVRKN